MLHPYNRSFSIISLIMHDHDVIFIPKFQNSFTLSSWVLISNLVFVATHLLWFSKFGLISLIMHDYDVIISHHHKKVLVSRSLQYYGHITKKIGPKNSLLKICTWGPIYRHLSAPLFVILDIPGTVHFSFNKLYISLHIHHDNFFILFISKNVLTG